MADQVSELNSRLFLARQRLQSLKPSTTSEQVRFAHAKLRLANACGRREEELAVFAHGLGDAEFATEQQWASLAAHQRAVASVESDCMALQYTALLRQTEPVASVCDAADHLLSEFSSLAATPRTHYVLISAAEQFKGEISAIHLSLGRLDIWGFSRLAHEFGHLWAEEQANTGDGLQKTFVRALAGNWDEALAKEFFADILATYLLGPCYVYSCLLLDFNPNDRQRSESHPGADERAHVVLAALQEMAKTFEATTAGMLRTMVSELEDFWYRSRTAAGAGGPLQNQMKLQWETAKLLKPVRKSIPGAEYRSLAQAYAVANSLSNGRGRPHSVSSMDILNGAWLRRRTVRRDDIYEIGNCALQMLRNSELPDE